MPSAEQQSLRRETDMIVRLEADGGKLGSEEFCEIGPAMVWMADYPEHIAPKSLHKYRLKSAILSERIVNQTFELAQCFQIVTKH